MSEPVRPDEAAQALAEIGQRHEQMVDTATIPNWYWWAIAALMIGFAAAADSRVDSVTGIAAALFAIGVVSLTLRVVLGGLRRARLRNDLLGARGVAAILGFVAVVLAISLPVAFILDAIGYGHPALVGVGIGALLLAVGGPLLMRYLHALMMANQAGGAR
jgi:hypothetical protein